MSNKRERTLRWLVVLLYASLVLFVGFLHTEKSLNEDKNCPACKFMRSAIGASPPPAYIPAVLFSAERTEQDRPIIAKQVAVAEFASRAPPLG
jgi:hypothetical protein